LTPPFVQSLPDPAAYRAGLVSVGASFPLPRVPAASGGLLAQLPPPPPGRTGWPWTVETTPLATAATAAAWPLVTIVTPSFKQADFLEETIRSVLLQNYPHLEFVVIDGGSPDASPAIIEKYRPWLSFARVARDRGQSHAINLGFSLAGGALLGWLNSDDFYLQGTLRDVATAWNRGARFIYGDGLNLDHASGQMAYLPANFAHPRYVKFPGLVIQPATFWSAAHHRPVWEEQHCALDYELWIRLLPGLHAHYLSRPLAVARQHDAAKTYNPAMQQRWADDAHRNALAHPALYRARPWLDREYRIVQRVAALLRRRALVGRLASVYRECGWSASAASPSG
jgi:glycosyltransferase involved in cell wall biosynthesis